MAQFIEGPCKAFTSGAAIGQYLRVTLSSGTLALAGADAPGIGTTETPSFAASEPQTVRLWSAQGTRKVVASAAITAGAIVYAGAAGKVSASGNHALGRALESATADGDIIEMMPFNSDLGAARVLRTRFTTAQVNAGATVLTALPGLRYRVHDCAMIAIGGNAATATTIDLLGTQSASSVKLVANAVAGLTQNTLLRAGATNSTILAGGVSFALNDANTAITINKTGSDLATATHIDVLLTYDIEV
jgi:hypothetical protein